MKKILISIITILGIGVSFCSADTFDIHNYYSNVSCVSNFTAYNKNAPYRFGVSNNSIVLKSFCFSNCLGDWCSNGSLGKIVYSINSGNVLSTSVSYVSTGDLWCFDFPENTIINPGDYFLYNAWGMDRNSSTSPSNYDLTSKGNGGTWFNNCAYRPVNIDGEYGYKYVDNFGINILNYGGYTAITPVVYYDIYQTSPKFVVNYGNTSYEYELEDNLSIYLKSPIIQSGNTFTYAGSTGINLFYNNTSDFYSKNKLYLNSMFWYNNNIFTPICL